MKNEKQFYFLKVYGIESKEMNDSAHIFKSLTKNNTDSFVKTFYLFTKSMDKYAGENDYCVYFYDGLEEININFHMPFAPYAKMIHSNCLRKVTFSKQFTKIPYFFFKSCPKLEEVVFEGHIKDIEQSAFYRTPSLKRVVFKQNTNYEIRSMFRYPFGRNFFEKKMVFPS